MEQELISKVWQFSSLIGRVTPGVLTFKKGQVGFITEDGIQFNVPLAEVKNVRYPFLRIGLGFDTVVNGKKYKFSFTKPNPLAPELDDTATDRLLRHTDAGRFLDSIHTLRNVKTDKATTRVWKEILKKI